MADLSLVAHEERMWQRQTNMQRLLDLQAQEQTLAALQAEVADRINGVVNMERRLEEQFSSNEEIKRIHLKRRERNSKRELGAVLHGLQCCMAGDLCEQCCMTLIE